MTEFEFLSTLPWTDRLAWALIHFVWQGGLICAAFVAVRSLLALTPRARYGLACTALALMALAPLVTFLLLAPGETRGYAFNYLPGRATVETHRGWGLAETVPAWLPWIVAGWLTGAVAFLVRLAGGWLVAARLRFAGTVRPAPLDWQRRLNTLAECIGITRPVRLLVSSLIQTPMALGHLRPVVLTPIGALTGLPADQVEALLAHELAHIWRNDYLANLLQSVAEALLFYHPAVWWVSKQIRMERELCCDDIAVAVAGDRVLYARALAELEAFRPVHAQSALAANGGDLLARIRRLVDPTVPQPRPGLGAALALGVLIFMGVAAATVTRPPSLRVAVAGFPHHGTGRVLTAINIRGISDEAASELAMRLPIHLGDRLVDGSLDQVRSVAEPYGRHIEVRIDYIGTDSALLDIHPAGLAGAPVVRPE